MERSHLIAILAGVGILVGCSSNSAGTSDGGSSPGTLADAGENLADAEATDAETTDGQGETSDIGTGSIDASSDAPSNGTQSFSYTGSDQTFTVPSGITAIAIKMALRHV
jgi:hypothetical protein